MGAQEAAPIIAELTQRLDAGDISPADFIAEARKTKAKIPEKGTDAELIAAIRPQAVWKPRQIIKTSDNYIVDGHHGWASDGAIDYGSGEEVMVESYQIQGDIIEILKIAEQWASAMGSPPQGAGTYGPDGLTDDQRAYRRRRRSAGWGGWGFLESALAQTPPTPEEIGGVTPAPEGAPGCAPAAPVAV